MVLSPLIGSVFTLSSSWVGSGWLASGVSVWFLAGLSGAWFLQSWQPSAHSYPYPQSILLGFALAALSVGVMTLNSNLKFLLLSGVLILAVSSGAWQPRYWRAVWVINYFVILLFLAPSSVLWWRNGCFIMAGFFCLIGGLCGINVWRVRGSARHHLALTLRQAGTLVDSTFVLYLTGDYQERLFDYEKNLHHERAKYLTRYAAYRQACQTAAPADVARALLFGQQCEKIYEILSALTLAVRRSIDHSTFAVAQKELCAVSVRMMHFCLALADYLTRRRQTLPDVTGFAEDFSALQDIYQDALQVVAPDPLVFILLIHDIGALQQALLSIATLLRETPP